MINRVPFDPRREQRGPSEQWVTLWPLSSAESRESLEFIEQCEPQGIVLHADGYTLARNGHAIASRMRGRFPQIQIGGAIAGDWDRASEPGYIDGWIPAFQMAQDNGFVFMQPNREVAWKSRPKGSGDASLLTLKTRFPSMKLWHTSYGAPANVDRDLPRPGYQGFGGHSGGSLWEFSDDDGDTDGECPQFYFGSPDGERGDRLYQLSLADAYARSWAKAREIGRVAKTIPVYAYLQAYNCRVDALCYTSEWYPKTQWWAVPSRVDDAGRIAVACLSELYRQWLSVEQFQAQMGLTVDGWMGPKTYAELLPFARWKHPQAIDGKSPMDSNKGEFR